jgi:hypothetical protein
MGEVITFFVFVASYSQGRHTRNSGLLLWFFFFHSPFSPVPFAFSVGKFVLWDTHKINSVFFPFFPCSSLAEGIRHHGKEWGIGEHGNGFYSLARKRIRSFGTIFLLELVIKLVFRTQQ